jgi:hypothetical protein
VPRLCSHGLITRTCRRNRVLTPHMDEELRLSDEGAWSGPARAPGAGSSCWPGGVDRASGDAKMGRRRNAAHPMPRVLEAHPDRVHDRVARGRSTTHFGSDSTRSLPARRTRPLRLFVQTSSRTQSGTIEEADNPPLVVLGWVGRGRGNLRPAHRVCLMASALMRTRSRGRWPRSW